MMFLSFSFRDIYWDYNGEIQKEGIKMRNFMYGLTHPIKVFTDTMAYGTTPLKIFAVAMYVISIVGGFIGGYYLTNLFI